MSIVLNVEEELENIEKQGKFIFKVKPGYAHIAEAMEHPQFRTVIDKHFDNWDDINYFVSVIKIYQMSEIFYKNKYPNNEINAYHKISFLEDAFNKSKSKILSSINDCNDYRHNSIEILSKGFTIEFSYNNIIKELELSEQSYFERENSFYTRLKELIFKRETSYNNIHTQSIIESDISFNNRLKYLIIEHESSNKNILKEFELREQSIIERENFYNSKLKELELREQSIIERENSHNKELHDHNKRFQIT
jgi:hypothetical protein